MIHYEIPRRGRHCSEGKEEMIRGMDYYSLLVNNEKGGYERFDYCPACWEKKKNEAGILWKSKVPNLGKVKEEEQFKSRSEKALYLLKEAIKEGNHQEAFILGLLLVRCKVLVARSQVEQENMTLYEVVNTEEMLFVPKVELNSIQTSELQAKLASSLRDGSRQSTSTISAATESKNAPDDNLDS